MRTFTKLPRCEKHKLLRTLAAGNVVVSSTALHDHLGNARYQRFIETIAGTRQPNMGFDPDSVERFLADKPGP